MTHHGPMLIYFNRELGSTRGVWCVAPPDRAWELHVRSVTISLPSAPHYAHPDPAFPREAYTPDQQRAMFELFGTLDVDAEGNAALTELPPRVAP